MIFRINFGCRQTLDIQSMWGWFSGFQGNIRRKKPYPVCRMLLTTVLLLSGSSAALSEGQVQVTVDLRFMIHNPRPPMELNGDEMSESLLHRNGGVLYYRDGDDYRAVNLRENQVSSPYLYEGFREFHLYQRIPARSLDQPDNYIPRMVATLGAGSGEYLLIAHPNRKGGERGDLIRLLALPVDPPSVAEGMVLAVNLSDAHLVLAVGEERLGIAPFESRRLDVSGAHSRFQVMAAVSERGAYTLVYRRVWRQHPNKRAVVLFYPLPNNPRNWTSKDILLD